MGVRLSPDELRLLDSYAKRHRVSRSEAMRRLMRKGLITEKSSDPTASI